MDIRIRRRLNEVDGFVIHIITEHYNSVILWRESNGKSINKCDYNRYMDSIVKIAVNNLVHYFSHKKVINTFDNNEISFQLERYIVSNYTNKIYEEFEKANLLIETNKQYGY